MAEPPAPAQPDFRLIAEETYDWESWLSPDGQLLWVNPAVERLTGYTVADCRKMANYPLDMVDPGDRRLIADALAEGRRGGSGNDLVFRIRRKDGYLTWAAISWRQVCDQSGQVLGLRTSVRDTSRRKAAEETLRRAFEEIERSNAAKSRFLAAASHDLRQPLQAARMFATTLGMVVEADEAKTMVDHLRASLAATDELLTALLDISRLDAGTLRADRQAVHLAPLMQRLGVELTAIAAERGLSFSVVPCDLWVMSDPGLLERILRNLLQNAIRYTQTGGVLMGVRRGAGVVRLQIVDTGIGIPDDARARIFDEFFQIGNPERDRTRGLGLGLAIVDRLARLLGHNVRVASRLDRGSVFTVEMEPTEGVEARPPEPVAGVDLDGRVILAIDDDRVQLMALSGYLGHLGAQVVTAGSLEEALVRVYGGVMPDLVLSDFRLRGGATGGAAIDAVRAAVGEDIPAVILTGDTAPDRLLEAESHQAQLLHKPINPELLAAVLSKIVAERVPDQAGG